MAVGSLYHPADNLLDLGSRKFWFARHSVTDSHRYSNGHLSRLSLGTKFNTLPNTSAGFGVSGLSNGVE